MVKTHPTVFHITHYKAGSQWVLQVLQECAPDRYVQPHVLLEQFYKEPIIPGGVYPTVYVPYQRFQDTMFPKVDLDPATYQYSANDEPSVKNWYNFSVKKSPIKTFVVIRDLRDTLVSLYFSIKVSHAELSDQISKGRVELNEMSFEDGFLWVLKQRSPVQARIQSSWLPVCQSGESIMVRYEDLLADEVGQFEKIIDHCEITLSRFRLHQIIKSNSFANRTGRKPGEEDVSSHYRKGISGDWKNHFTEPLKAFFKRRYGQILIDTGYEKDLNW